MRALAKALATAHAIAIGLAFLLALFVSSFPWENLAPEDEEDFDRVALLLVGCLVSAGATAVAVALNRYSWAAIAFVAQLGLGVVALDIALSHSDHSDGRLVLFTLGVEVAGSAGVVICAPRGRRHA